MLNLPVRELTCPKLLLDRPPRCEPLLTMTMTTMMLSTTFASLPVEVVHSIFAYACAPDASQSHPRPVAPAINLVSRAFREICLSTGPDLEYVTIRGIKRMVAFIALLARRNMCAKCVRCLFLQVSNTRCEPNRSSSRSES